MAGSGEKAEPAKTLNWAFCRRLGGLLRILFPSPLNDSTWLFLFVLIVSIINQVLLRPFQGGPKVLTHGQVPVTIYQFTANRKLQW